MKIFRYCAVLIVFAAGISGCCGGGSTEVKAVTTTTTTGQQLIDLKKAYDSGAIDEKQYKKMKEEIVDKAGGN